MEEITHFITCTLIKDLSSHDNDLVDFAPKQCEVGHGTLESLQYFYTGAP